MNVLLDTHVFLWAVSDDPNMSPPARDVITDDANVVFVSAATTWEIAINRALGKLSAPNGDYLEELHLHRFLPLDITTDHALAVEKLPSLHPDPLDRMQIAQALEERLFLLTRDRRIMAYDVRIIEA